MSAMKSVHTTSASQEANRWIQEVSITVTLNYPIETREYQYEAAREALDAAYKQMKAALKL
jgi:hypothetical protein